MSTEMPGITPEANGRRAITVRFEDPLYRALEEAGELRGSTSMSDTLRMAAMRFIAEASADADIVEDVRRKQAALRARTNELLGERRPGQASRDETPHKSGERSRAHRGTETARGRAASHAGADEA